MKYSLTRYEPSPFGVQKAMLVPGKADVQAQQEFTVENNALRKQQSADTPYNFSPHHFLYYNIYSIQFSIFSKSAQGYLLQLHLQEHLS